MHTPWPLFYVIIAFQTIDSSLFEISPFLFLTLFFLDIPLTSLNVLFRLFHKQLFLNQHFIF